MAISYKVKSLSTGKWRYLYRYIRVC